MSVGTYIKRIQNTDDSSLQSGGGTFAHRLNVPALNCWTQVILNMHAHVAEGEEKDAGNLAHPTAEPAYNYFDALTRFYIEARSLPSQYPADYLLDEMEFYQEARPENDDQIYGITATHVPEQNRLIVTWSRRLGEDDISHEVRYAFADVFSTGWDKARVAPKGSVAPLERNGMVYDSKDLPLTGQRQVYIAIKPRNSKLFSQIVVPLTLK